MSISINRLTTAAGIFLFGSLLAQDSSEIPPPKFPLKLRAPELASWTITRETKQVPPPEGSEKMAEPFVRKLSVVKSFPIYFEQAEVTNGKNWEKWIFITSKGTFRFVRYEGDAKWNKLWDSAYDEISRYEKSDFEHIEWVGASTYKGIEESADGTFYAFSIESPTPLIRRDYKYVTVSEGGNRGFRAQALLDTDSSLPVKIDNDYEISTYSYGAPPRSKLAPPPEVLEELKEWVQKVQK